MASTETPRGELPEHADCSIAGGVSFARVFEAGHAAQFYQPETVFQLVNRAIFGKDLATGTQSRDGYSSVGAADTFSVKDELPESMAPVCYLYSVQGTCTMDQYKALLKGDAKIVDYLVVEPAAGGGPIG